MFNRVSDETRLKTAIALHHVAAGPLALASAAKKKAQQHPAAASIAAGVVGGAVLSVILVDGEKAQPGSLYDTLFN